VNTPTKKKSKKKSTGRSEVTGSLWMRFAGGLLKRLSRIFGAGRQKNKNEVVTPLA